MRLSAEYLFFGRQVPYFDHAIAAATGGSLETLRVICEHIAAIDMALPELGNEGGCEDSIELGCIQRTLSNVSASWRLQGADVGQGIVASNRQGTRKIPYIPLLVQMDAVRGQGFLVDGTRSSPVPDGPPSSE